MISYALKCEQGHGFDSWFQSAAAYDVLARSGHLTCSHCGSTKVSKAVMAPRIAANLGSAEAPAPTSAAAARGAGAAPAGAGASDGAAVSKSPPFDVEASIAELRRKVEENAEYVGRDFTKQAREIHLGQSPARPIYGEARPDQARSLIEDGIPLLPLPFRPRRKLS